MGFSFIFDGRPEHMPEEDFIQTLFTTALGIVDNLSDILPRIFLCEQRSQNSMWSSLHALLSV